MQVLLYIALIVAGTIRLSRWLSLVQQKEYRSDRLKLFLASTEGIRELVRIFPRPSDFSRMGLKRPKLTSRSGVVGLISILFTIVFVSIGFWFSHQPNQLFDSADNLLKLWIFGWYILIPLIVLLSVIPTSFLSIFHTQLMLMRAKRKINKSKPLIIGITGSYGKTATKQLLAQLLKADQSVFATPKSYNTRYSVAQSIVEHYRGQSIIILEYGAYTRGEIAYLARWFVPNIAVITGLTEQHLGLFGSVDAIIEAKSELIAALPLDGLIFYNVSNSAVKKIIARGVEKWRSRHRTDKAIQIVACGQQNSGLPFQFATTKLGYLVAKIGRRSVQTSLVGEFNSQSVLVAAAIAQHLGVSTETIFKQLKTFKPTESFITCKTLKSGARVIDDGGTSNPEGFSEALKILKQLPGKKKYLVTAGIVDLGRASNDIHLKLAKEAKKTTDVVMYVGWSGYAEFLSVFGDSCITSRRSVEATLRSVEANAVVLIEGKVPGWVRTILDEV